MATSIIKKAAKTLAKTDAPVDLSRRSLFKLPAVSEPSTLPAAPTPAPSGLEALERVAQAPVSRRDVLKSAAGQAARAVMPSGLEALAAPVVRQAAGEAVGQAVAPAPVSPFALIAQAIRMGMGKDEAIEFVLGRMPGADRAHDLDIVYDTLTNPKRAIDTDKDMLYMPGSREGTYERLMGPAELLEQQLDVFGDLKDTLRALKSNMDPAKYEQMKNAVREVLEKEKRSKFYIRRFDEKGAPIEKNIGRWEPERLKASGGIIKKAAKTLAKMDEPLDLAKRGMFRLPDKDQPLMEIPKGAPTVTEKTLEVAPEGVKGQKVTKSVIDTPVSRRTVIKSAGSQAAQRVMPKLPGSGVPQVTAKDLFGSAKSMPELYASMLPLVRKVAPEELASMADRLGFTIDDIIAMSGEDLLPRGDLTMEGLTRFEELFPITASRVLKKAGGGIIKKAAQAAAKPAARERVYHAGAEFTTPNPGLFTNPDLPAVQRFKAAMGAPRLHEFEAAPKRTGSEQDVYNVARRLGIFQPNVPASQYLEQGENAVFAEAPRVLAELRRAGFDSLRLSDGISPQPSLVALDPAILSRPVPEQKMLQGFYRGYSGDYDAQRAAQEAGKVYVTPQKALGDFYAEKRAAQTGQEPHLEMVLADPFAGKTYGHSVPGTKGEPPKVTRARRLKPEDVKSSTRLYAEGGAVAGSQLNDMVSNAMKNGMSEAEALRQLLPLFK